jgi:hypothetical protein
MAHVGNCLLYLRHAAIHPCAVFLHAACHVVVGFMKCNDVTTHKDELVGDFVMIVLVLTRASKY